MKRIFIAIFLVLCGFGLLKAQSEIDFKPKLLIRELTNMKGQSQPLLSEIVLQDVQSNQAFEGKFFIIGDHATPNTNRYVYIGRVNSCRSGGCSVNDHNSSDQTSEYFDYFILFDASCIVRQVRVYNYQATHGQEITAASWLKQFIGYGSENAMNTGKNIDAISGATISVAVITYDIHDKSSMLKQIVQKSGIADWNPNFAIPPARSDGRE